MWVSRILQKYIAWLKHFSAMWHMSDIIVTAEFWVAVQDYWNSKDVLYIHIYTHIHLYVVSKYIYTIHILRSIWIILSEIKRKKKKKRKHWYPICSRNIPQQISAQAVQVYLSYKRVKRQLYGGKSTLSLQMGGLINLSEVIKNKF